MRQERIQKSARIPVRVRNGQVEFLYDVELPPLKNGAVGELVVDVENVQDPKWRAFLVAETPVELAPAGAMVVFGVAVDKGALLFERHLVNERTNRELTGAVPLEPIPDEALLVFGEGVGVLATLHQPLVLVLRGENLSQLDSCAVSVPALGEMKRRHEAPTLNQALILVSQTFEPERQGNNGDAFRDVYLLRDGEWILLDDIRSAEEARHEEERWKTMGLDPQKVRERISNEGGLLPNDSTRSTG